MKKTLLLVVALTLVAITASAGLAAKRTGDETDAKRPAGKRTTPTQSTAAKPATTTTETPIITPSTQTAPLEVTAPVTVTTPAPTTPAATVAPAAGEQIKWQVISSGGNTSSSASYSLSSTVGQTAVGVSSSPSYQLRHGFWQTFSSSCCVGDRGDVFPLAGGDGAVDISDLQIYIDFLFFSGPAPSCPEEFDTAGNDNAVDISDLQAVIDFLFFASSLPAC